MSAGVIISDPKVKMKQSEKNAKKLCHRCHNINVVSCPDTNVFVNVKNMSDVRSQISALSLTLVPRASSQSHQTSLIGAVSRQVPTLLSCQVNLGNVQEVS